MESMAKESVNLDFRLKNKWNKELSFRLNKA